MNINLACELIKKMVIENALEEIKKDIKFKKEIKR